MTEAEWTAAIDVSQLLKWLPRGKRRRPSIRKLQLLANAFVDRISTQFADSLSTQVRLFMDRLADAPITREAYQREWWALRDQLDTLNLDHSHILCWAAYVSEPVVKSIYGTPETCVRSVAGSICRVLGKSEGVNQVRLLREVLPNPFRPVTFPPSWRTDTAIALAQQMYDSREFSAMPILADALQDAGCDNPDVLEHCRDANQVHVRGCWVVDLVLGKS